MSTDKNPTRKRKTLGRGLSALFGEASAGELKPAKESGHQLVPIDEIMPGPGQPRRLFQKKDLESLAESIKNKGVLQPLLLRRSSQQQHMFEIVAGERRWRAAQLAQIHEVPAIIDDYDDKEIIEIGLIENIQREDLKISEEAQAYQRLIDKNNYTHENLAQIVGKSRSHITNLLRILNLDKYFLSLLNKGIITMGHARALVGKTPDNFDEKTLSIISSGKISVRDLEKNKRRAQNIEPNLIQEEKNLSSTIGFKTKITYGKKGKGNIKIFYENLEQYNFLINKLKN